MWLDKDRKLEDFDYLAEVKEFHRQFAEPYKGKPKGCWDFEIRALEKSFGFELPLAYKQYLAWMGKDYNGVFVGCDWFISNVEDNTALVPELLTENNISFVLPENYLCFFSHQGYIAAWFGNRIYWLWFNAGFFRFYLRNCVYYAKIPCCARAQYYFHIHHNRSAGLYTIPFGRL